MSNRVKAKINKKKRFRCPNCHAKDCDTKVFADGVKIYICQRCGKDWREA